MSIAGSRRSTILSLSATLKRGDKPYMWGTNVNKFTVNKLNNHIRGVEGDDALICFQYDITDSDMILAVTECDKAVGLLDRSKKKLLEAMYGLEWWKRSDKVQTLFHRWTINLLTAQVYHAPIVLTAIIKHFTKGDDSEMGSAESKMYTPLHNLIAEIISTIPLSADILVKCATDNFPYYKHGCAANRNYIHNLLWITLYVPTLTESILTIVINRLIILDVNIKYPDESHEEKDLFAMEDIDNEPEKLINTLDMCMIEVFRWLEQETTDVVDVVFSVFERTLLPTFGTKNIQYLILFSLSRNINKLESFLEFLWRVVESARVGPDLRQSSIAYLGGILARANFTPPELVNFYVTKMADWCHSYIKAQDMIQSSSGINNPHVVFHSVAQCLFYLLAFKHKHFFSNKSKLTFVESLGLPKIIMSPLNPLRVCQYAVAESFASVTRQHQIVYCHAVMENNMRNYLRFSGETIKHLEWFPFDPYTLPKSFVWIQPMYAEYEDMFIENIKHVDGMHDDDDFLAKSPISDLPGSIPKFSFSNMRNFYS